MDVKGDDQLGTVLITGGAGFLGSNLVDAFKADGSWTEVGATLRSQRKDQYRADGAKYHICDLTDGGKVQEVLDLVKPRAIIHTAATTPFALNKDMYRVNVEATKNLLELAKEHPNVEAFVYTSSTAACVFKSGFNDKPETEEESILCSWESGETAYSRAKGATESLVIKANSRERKNDKDFSGYLLTTAIRLPRLYGARDNSMIPNFLNLTNKFGARVQLGQNRPVHDFLYIDSASRILIQAVKALLEGPRSEVTKVDGESFFVSDGKPVKMWDFAHKLWATAGDRNWSKPEGVSVIKIPFWFLLSIAFVMKWIFKVFTLDTKIPPVSDQHFLFIRKGCWCSIEKARQRLGYEPVCDTDEGIRRTVAWFKENEGFQGRWT